MSERVVLYIEFVGGGEPQDDGSITASATARRVLVGGGTGGEASSLARSLGELAPQTVALRTSVTRPAGDGARFAEAGELVMGALGSVRIESAHDGVDGAAAVPGEIGGAVVFRITGGTGSFADAAGWVTSNFVVTAEGVLHDAQVATIETRILG